ncbi:hypothetical protein [Desulfovibrio litoralis]|uniref:phenylalanine--tRNA ligase subunit beta-related protein n=1 Tax=Desulfovibrio litoralis TaxID=466107 RepID=UPI000A071777|nr:hypothetical protein [Desulfovibrio litoralis]
MCPLGLKYSELYTAVVALKRPLLEHIEFIDVFSPEGKNERNLTIRLTFRHAEKTLKDTDVDKERETIVNAIQKTLGLSV